MTTHFLRVFSAVLASHFSSAISVTPKEIQAVKNAQYEVKFDDGSREKVIFKDGSFNRRVDDIEYKFGLGKDPLLITDKGFAFVVMGVTKGGTGSWSTIKQVDLKSSPPSEIAEYPMEEDRIKIVDLKLERNKLKVGVVKHSPTDPLCCPTVKDTLEYPIR